MPSYNRKAPVNARDLSWTLFFLKPPIPQMLAPTESPGRFVKTLISGPTPRVSVSVVVEWVPKTCISNRFPGDVGAAGCRTILYELLA